ncbi:hypothetical protein MPF19_01300 [Polaribacter sp. Z014]|uniref:hypothetical protein n=1 Tax=unclassified Polaribacter TaxID=196858 RepID=UPI00193B813F|nr:MULTISPECIES: hypothetical protein [unclassified Polaribacter]MCL7762032.1 hypothetical protein [Polaribacter sp. Z014]QVY64536.1 hypothetical protein JOP69_12245 [Polaribacter sp. Q13]
MFKSLRITCDEATTICDKSQYGAATLGEKVKLSIHFLRCKVCSLYTKQNNTLTNLYKGHAKSCKETKRCLSKEEKEALKKELDKIKI